VQPAHARLHCRRPDGSPYPQEDCPLLGVLTTGRRADADVDAFQRADGTLLPVSWVSSPVVQDGEVSGAVVVFRSEQVRQALDAQRREALDAARAEQARVQAAHDRLQLLSQAGQVLASTLDLPQAVRRLSRLLANRLADWCALDVLDESGQLTRLALTHRDAARVPAGVVPHALPDPSRSRAPLADVLRTGEPLLLTDLPPERPAGGPVDELLDAQSALFRDLQARAALVVPLAVGRRVLGALTLVRTGERGFTPEDVDLAEDLARRAALAVDNARLHTAQRDVAETLQRSLLTMLPHVDHITLAARYEPAGRHAQVGGDWYDSFLMPDGCTALVIGDIAGHDVEAAARMGQVRNMLRAIAVDRRDHPDEVLRRLDLAIDAFRAAEFATVVFGRVELLDEPVGARLFRWSNAGHPPPLLVHADGHAELLSEEPDLPLGVLPGAPRTEHTRVLPPGSTLLLYTDGLVERRHDQVETGPTRLRQVAARSAGLPVAAFCDAVLAGLAGTHDVSDDVALIALHVPLPEDDGPPPQDRVEQGRARQAHGQPRLTATSPGPPAPEEP
jgi:serine phosphatase RsbU (regulator of sigma subunit)